MSAKGPASSRKVFSIPFHTKSTNNRVTNLIHWMDKFWDSKNGEITKFYSDIPRTKLPLSCIVLEACNLQYVPQPGLQCWHIAVSCLSHSEERQGGKNWSNPKPPKTWVKPAQWKTYKELLQLNKKAAWFFAKIDKSLFSHLSKRMQAGWINP